MDGVVACHIMICTWCISVECMLESLRNCRFGLLIKGVGQSPSPSLLDQEIFKVTLREMGRADALTTGKNEGISEKRSANGNKIKVE